MSHKNITVKKLDTDELIEDACALLYKEYIETNSWVFSNDNPSKLKIITKNNRKLLVDRITPLAIWFGAFCDDEIIGCIRLFKATKNVSLEIETYPAAKEIVEQYIEINKPNIYEGSRACVDYKHKGKNILAILYLKILEHCQKEKASIFGSASNRYVRSLLLRIQWPCKKEDAFKFEESDLTPASFYLANDAEITNIIKNIKLLENKRNRKELNIFDALKMIAPIFPAPIYWHDTQGILLGINTRCLKGMGKSIEEVLGKTPYDFYPKKIADHIWQNSLEVLRKGETLSQEEYAYDISGECIGTYLAIKAPLYDKNDQVLGVLGTSIDITDKKNLENQLKAANELKTQFIQNMQHDLRTPTSGCMGMLQHLATQETDSEKKDDLVLLYKAAKNIYEICDEIIDFEQLTHQHNPVLAKKFNLRELVQNVIELNAPAAKIRQLELSYEISSDVPNIIVGDPKRLSRLLINLVGNAVKFTEVGFVKVEVDAVDLTDKKNIVLEFKVSDSGIGIPADKKNLIYEKFTRLNPSNQGYYAGSGLGLNIVKRYVEDLSGEIEVESELKKGTVFHVTLPFEMPLSNRVYDKVSSSQEEIEDVKFAEEKIIPKDVVSAPTKEGQLNILFIEDQKLAMVATLMTVENVVSSNNSKAENVAEAMKLLREKRFDLVISDLGLPDGDGADIVRTIKSDPTELNYKTPFFALTAHNDFNKKAETEAAGFLVMLTKPLKADRIKMLVDLHVHKKEPLQDTAISEEDKKIIDLELGKKLTNYHDGLIFELLGMLARELPKDLLLIEDAVKQNNMERLRAELHKFKGGLGYCGVPRLQAATMELENLANNVSDATQLKDLLQIFYKEANIFLDAQKHLST